jgi:hypothetical protein
VFRLVKIAGENEAVRPFTLFVWPNLLHAGRKGAGDLSLIAVADLSLDLFLCDQDPGVQKLTFAVDSSGIDPLVSLVRQAVKLVQAAS